MPNGMLSGKVAIITGAGRGIGKAIAVAYAANGAAVCCAARTAAEIQDVAKHIESSGGKAIAVTTDVTRLVAVENMYQKTVEAFGGVDIIVVNAGGNFDRNTVEDSDHENWVKTIDLNINGAYYCAKAAIPHLKSRGGGKMIMVGSGVGHNGRVGSSAYAASKAGLWAMTRVLAQELWQYNISVNELVPGPVETQLSSEGRGGEQSTVFEINSEWVKQPEDVVPLAMFLATQPDTGPTAQSFSLMRRDT